MSKNDLLIKNGEIHLLDGNQTVVDALLFRDGKVEEVGDSALEKTEDAEVLDLEGRTVLPGFNDSHTHIINEGTDLLETDLSSVESRDEAFEKLRENADKTDEDEWVLGFGYDESTWPEGERTRLRRYELDEVSEDHPMVAWRVDGHTASLNSVALEKIDFEDEGVEHDVVTEGGESNGVVVEDAAAVVSKHTYPDPEKARRALDAAIEKAQKLGVTSIQNMAGVTSYEGRGDPFYEAFFSAWREGLGLRITFYVDKDEVESLADLEIPSGFGDDYLKIGGLKMFSDGSLGSKTAKLHGEYTDGGDGQMVNDVEELEEKFRVAAEADEQIATHAIGGEAIDRVLDAYENVLEDGEYSQDIDPRLRVEHFEFASDEAIERMKDLGVVASMQPNFLRWSKPDGLYENRLGKGSLPRNNRFRDVLDAGVDLVFGSDMMPFDPLYGIHHAVNTEYDTKQITVREAVEAYTKKAAYTEFAENKKGTLEKGMLGDAVVLSANPFENPEDIKGIEVEATVLGGEVVYSDM